MDRSSRRSVTWSPSGHLLDIVQRTSRRDGRLTGMRGAELIILVLDSSLLFRSEASSGYKLREWTEEVRSSSWGGRLSVLGLVRTASVQGLVAENSYSKKRGKDKGSRSVIDSIQSDCA